MIWFEGRIRMSTPYKNELNKDTITFSESEIEEISKLYQTALDLTSSNEDVLLDNSNIGTPKLGLINKKRQAWHDVQNYLEELGKKYNYDPEKYVINKITRKLEPYNPKS